MAFPEPRATFNYYLQVQEDLNYEMRRVLLRTASQIERDILDVTGNGIGAQIRREQLRAVKKALHARLAVLYKDAGYIVQSNRQKAAAAAIDAFQAYEKVLLTNVATVVDVAAYLESAKLTSKAGVDAVMRRVMGKSYRPLSYSIYQSEKLARGIVDRMVESALTKGLSAREFAGSVRSLINPNVRGGVSYAANRLARTEINNAFHSVSKDRYRTSGLVTGVDWNLSGAHPEGDECDDLATNSPYDPNSVPEKPHPMCFCYVTPRVPSEDEFLDKFFAGDYGDEPWAASEFEL